ncbi:MAG TPA: endopeptidase La [Blastocatellia bacterium]|nr:endopeptidase La [Blastocatellia bacterium]HMX25306.1 endopeptidase La [Blastocatellia bacterium]HMY71092.1 endopeptidase La [Blastocatellia bacterium]HNG28277.1 endopeptidase La [Blastocatellia bacterium]
MQEFHDSTPTDVVRYPMVPIRDVVVFPHTKAAFVIGRPSSVRALEEALATNKIIFLATQHDATIEDPAPDQIYPVGTLAYIANSLRKPDEATIKVLVEGRERARAVRVEERDGYSMATLRRAPVVTENNKRITSLVSRIASLVEQYLKIAQEGNLDQIQAALRAPDAGQIVDQLADKMKLDLPDKQALLETYPTHARLVKMAEILEVEIEKVNLERTIQTRVKRQMEKQQREYYLNEKIKAIHKELGRKDEHAEHEELRQKIEQSGMTKEAEEKALAELQRLEQMPPMSAETTVSRNYLDWLITVPWKESSEEIRDISHAQSVLDADHYGLEKIKERILEYLAVRQLVEKPRGSILCFVGPPGVGKTSLGRSIAKATGRKFVRLSLGGVRDEAEIRGHRRTYIGALPGQIIQMMKKAGTVNPLMLLDEVDKLGRDFRGDPSAALLEVLDPEQNHTFHDHFMDVEYDLSQVMFIATANVLHTIPPALQDRLEIIKLAGYTEREKMEIAKRHLIRKQCEANGLKAEQINFFDEGLKTLIECYTREAGVRNLEREVGSICRKVARRFVQQEKKKFHFVVDSAAAKQLLGAIKFRPLRVTERNEIGLVNGLAVTEVGGDVLQVEATLIEGGGKLTLTGKLGDVMQESAQAAITFIRSRAKELGIPAEFHKNRDLHIHVPEGAIPKDGPSAGITIATAMASALTRIPIHKEVAMTGEITLRGKVLPIGGVKEKILAAHRAGLTTVIIPRENEKDLSEIPADVLQELNVNPVETMDEVLQIALERLPSPRTDNLELTAPVWQQTATISGVAESPIA